MTGVINMSIPRFDGHLSTFVGDLRSHLFGSQTQAAHHFGLTAGTIWRYESGKRPPVIGYVASLAKQFVEQLDHQFDSGKQALLLSLNTAIRRSDCYAQELPFSDWEALCAVASAYMRERQGDMPDSDKVSHSTSPQCVTDWGEAPDVSLFYGREGELATLAEWIVNDGCRLVAVLGMGGQECLGDDVGDAD
jgi:transcriptional regulator with XRE-family HTH domain